ncbi:MAG TPA: sulfite exporter TauE/SafE family protein [Terriglobia bacterium]|nr:sulfite exporter TauE/SafE family protein [Terriglobia bacterium]
MNGLRTLTVVADLHGLGGVTGALLFLAAVLAGAMNAVAGGGSFISFPALTFTGVLPIPANATSTVALWPGAVASLGAYWKKLPRRARLVAAMTLTSMVGGLLGAVLLVHTSQSTFMRLVPYLFLGATLLFTFGKRLHEWARTLTHGAGRAPRDLSSWTIIAAAVPVQLAISVYGGFFGGGIGILMLAFLSVIGMEDINAMNAIKSLLQAAINAAAVVTFIAARIVVWPQALLMLVGAVVGAYGGARVAQRLDPRLVRGFVIAVGFSMTFYFLWKR